MDVAEESEQRKEVSHILYTYDERKENTWESWEHEFTNEEVLYQIQKNPKLGSIVTANSLSCLVWI